MPSPRSTKSPPPMVRKSLTGASIIASKPEDKAGWGTSFNGQPLILTLDDLKALEDAIHGQTLPATQGFFFGSDSYRDMDAEGHYSYYHDDLKFIAAARAYIANEYTVYYVCSW